MKSIVKYIPCIEKGKGGLKYYKYWTGGIILRSKKAVREAITLKLRLLRQDLITKEVELFDYRSLDFREVKQ